MTALDPKFMKVVALMRSTIHSGERAAARARAEAMAAAAGLSFDEAVAAAEAPATPTFVDISAGMDDFMERADPGYKARWAAERSERERQRLKRRAAIIARYGSEEAALAPCEREQLLHRALSKWRVVYERPWQRWTQEIKGCSHFTLADQIPAYIRAAVASAYPLPTTFPEAKAEQDYWRARCDEIEDVLGPENYGDSGLDTTAELRREIVRALVEYELPTKTLKELRDRLRYYDESEVDSVEIIAALVRDADALVAAEDAQPSNLSTPSAAAEHPSSGLDRDGQIKAALDADPSRPDRDIARACRCSPTTVGKVRRAMGLSQTPRSVQRGGQVFQMSFQSTLV